MVALDFQCTQCSVHLLEIEATWIKLAAESVEHLLVVFVLGIVDRLQEFSTASHGIRRRSAASASRARVNSFSFTRSLCRAASHSCGDATFGISMSVFQVCVLIFCLSLFSSTTGTRTVRVTSVARFQCAR